MSALSEHLADFAEAAVARKVFPGTAIGVVAGSRSEIVTAGRLTYEDDAPTARPDTIYDVASVTKSIPTSSLALMLVEEGRLGLDDLVVKYVPELTSAGAETATVRHLLTYTLILDLPGGLSKLAQEAESGLLAALLKRPLQSAPGHHYYYTNPPAVLLGMVVERVCGQTLAEAAQERLFGPLGMHDSTFTPTAAQLERIAPSELVEGRGEVRGEVQDEAAAALRKAGMVSGNAGLFSTVPDLLKFVRMVLNDGQAGGRHFFSKETIKHMGTNQIVNLHMATGLGWEIQRPEVMGRAARTGIILKSGFTGCLVVIDLRHDRALVHLSNRTYPQRPDREAIRAFWRQINELVFEQPRQ